MNKLLIALFASAFALAAAPALAVDYADNTMQPLSKMETKDAQAAKAAAKAKWDKMTPQEQEAAKKAAKARKQADQTALDYVAQESFRYDTKTGAEAAKASKDSGQKKPTKEQRQKDLSNQEKQPGS
jgi:hypothetical protein